MEDKDRREFARMVRSSSVAYRKVEYSEDDGMLIGSMLDCSGGGVRFSAVEPCAKKEQLVLELEFDGWVEEGEEWAWTKKKDDVGLLRVIGAVMWCKKNEDQSDNYEIGVRFTGRIK